MKPRALYLPTLCSEARGQCQSKLVLEGAISLVIHSIRYSTFRPAISAARRSVTRPGHDSVRARERTELVGNK